MVNNEKAGVLSLLIAVSGAAHAADITLNFSGNVTVTGCDISASSKQKQLLSVLWIWRKRQLVGQGLRP
ncbi:type 1 fimbrial protein [Providencia rettgeri]|nr:type 1 fimbrial protein [Providencia rettgeri]